MKNRLFVILIVPFIFVSCKTAGQEHLENMDVTLYKGIWGAPSCGIYDQSSNNYYVLGKLDNDVTPNSYSYHLTKLSTTGKVLKEASFGKYNKKELYKIYLSPSNRIFLVGKVVTENYQVVPWIIEVDRNLQVIQEIDIQEIAYHTEMLFLENEIVLINQIPSNNILIRKLDEKFNEKSRMTIEHPYKDFGGSFMSNQISYLTSNNKLIIAGSSTPFVEKNKGKYNYDTYVYGVNIKENKLEWHKYIGNDSRYLTADYIIQKDNSIYVAGIERNNDKDSLDFFNVVLYQFDSSGNLTNEIIGKSEIPDYVMSVAIFDNKILVSGRSMKTMKIMHNGEQTDGGRYVVMSKILKDGNLVDNKMLKEFHNIDDIRFTSNLTNNKILILGTTDKQRNWRIIVTNANNGYN